MFAAEDVPDADITRMTHGNAMRWYSFDPFTHVRKDEATVGALRRRAGGHDVSTCPAAPVCARPTRSSRASARVGGPLPRR